MKSPFLDVSQLGEPISTRDKDEIRFNCPYCGDESFHLYVNCKKGVYHCFKCEAAGRTNVRTMDLEIVRATTFSTGKAPTNQPIKLPHAHPDLITPVAMRYLVRRGVMEYDVARWKIYCAHPSSKYCGRLIIPYNPIRGFCSYFVARAYTSLPWPKYLNPQGSKDVLFCGPGLSSQSDAHFEQLWDLDTIVLVEGPFDCIKASRHGPAAALLGKDIKEVQRRILISAFTNVVLLLDTDSRLGTKTFHSALRIKDLLKVYLNVEIKHCPKGFKDPGEMGPNEFKELFDA